MTTLRMDEVKTASMMHHDAKNCVDWSYIDFYPILCDCWISNVKM